LRKRKPTTTQEDVTQNPPTTTPTDEDDDTTEGHRYRGFADIERAEGDDDTTEGHGMRGWWRLIGAPPGGRLSAAPHAPFPALLLR